MKNGFFRMLGLLLALLLLTACGRMDGEESSDTGTFSHREEQKTDLFSLSFPLKSFTSLTTQELLARGSKEHQVYADNMMFFLDTPLCLYGTHMSWNGSSGHTRYFAYDKWSGDISDACRDPLCDHTSCMWGIQIDGFRKIYCGKDGLFFVEEQTDDSQMGDGAVGGTDFQYYMTQIYATDFLGNDVERIYRTEGVVADLMQLGNDLWFYRTTWDSENETERNEVIRLDMEIGRSETVIAQTDWFYPLENALLYRPSAVGADGNATSASEAVYLRDLKTGADEVFFEEERGVCEYIIVGLYDNALYYRKYNMQEQTSILFRRGDGGFGEEESVEVPYGQSTNWSGDGFYGWEMTKNGGVLYRDGEEPYTVDVGYPCQDYLLDGDLFLFCYNIRIGGVADSYWRLIDLKTREYLEFTH
ncbi:MAG: hypothetical protein J1E00_05520 [Oscillospiraceae bacterium]|nr:hypothetical protein [Oscillospiraceae bacterium]